MVIVKSGPHVDLRVRLTPQRPPRQLDVFLLTDNAVYKNEVLYVLFDRSSAYFSQARSAAGSGSWPFRASALTIPAIGIPNITV